MYKHIQLGSRVDNTMGYNRKWWNFITSGRRRLQLLHNMWRWGSSPNWGLEVWAFGSLLTTCLYFHWNILSFYSNFVAFFLGVPVEYINVMYICINKPQRVYNLCLFQYMGRASLFKRFPAVGWFGCHVKLYDPIIQWISISNIHG